MLIVGSTRSHMATALQRLANLSVPCPGRPFRAQPASQPARRRAQTHSNHCEHRDHCHRCDHCHHCEPLPHHNPQNALPAPGHAHSSDEPSPPLQPPRPLPQCLRRNMSSRRLRLCHLCHLCPPCPPCQRPRWTRATRATTTTPSSCPDGAMPCAIASSPLCAGRRRGWR
jgi:hypothetical protein